VLSEGRSGSGQRLASRGGKAGGRERVAKIHPHRQAVVNDENAGLSAYSANSHSMITGAVNGLPALLIGRIHRN
jgi:hypothetical protein